jgi:flagellar assembly factor FliW
VFPAEEGTVEILTTRFGPITPQPQDRVEFPNGLIGVPQLKRFAIVRDAVQPSLIWLQSVRDPAWALALVPPRAIAPDYQIRATAELLRPIQVADSRDVDIYVILNRTVQSVTANLQAPILINRRRALGVQLVLSDAQYDVRYVVSVLPGLKKSA